MKPKYRAIQVIEIDDLKIQPGLFVDDLLDQKTIDELIKTGFVAKKIYSQKKKKVKDGNGKNS
jgi:hypothetical protein